MFMKNKWVSVKEKLPPSYTSVLVFNGSSVYIDSIVEHSIFDWEWCSTDDMSITHWMYLPKVPNNKKEYNNMIGEYF